MNDAETEQLLHRILCGYLSFYFRQEKYQLRAPSNEIKYEANLLYHNIINEEKYNEWIREENMLGIMIGLGLWNSSMNNIIKQTNTRIDNLKVELFQNFATTSKQKKIRQDLRFAKNQLNRILNTKQEFFNNTLEGYAISIKNEYIISNTLYKNNKKVFNYEANDSTTYSFFNDLVSEINKYVISIDDLKFLSRSNMWKTYWNANKNSVFPGSASEWTDDQRGLVNFSKMYDSVYEHPECPNDTVIEDDDMLDGWMIVQKRKAEKEKTRQTIDEVNPNLKNAQEVFLFANNNDDVNSILDLNSQESLHRMKQKIDMINSVGQIEDSNLPDVRVDIMNQLAEMRKAKV